MNNIKKSKIFWTNIVSVTIIILGLFNPEILAALGFTDSGKFLTIIGLISAVLSAILRTFFNNPTLDPSVKIGGRPPRTKKPTSFSPNEGFTFSENDFVLSDQVYFSLEQDGDRYGITISNITNQPNEQRILFVEPIEFTNLEDLTFYIY